MEALFQKHFLLGCAAVILILSTIPGSTVPEIEFQYLDKLVHVAMYTVLSSILYGYFVRNSKRPKLQIMVTAFLLASVYGVLMEILQYHFLESRSFEVYDIISNIIGSFIGVFLTIIFFNSKK